MLQDCPRSAEPVAVVRAHLGPLRHPAVQFGVDERRDVDTVHDDVLQFAADLDVDQLDAAHPAPVEQRAADLRPAEVDSVHLRVPKTHALETRSGEVLVVEPGHRHHASERNHN